MTSAKIDLDINRIGSQTERLTAEEEKALGEFFKNLKLKYQMERESEEKLPRKAEAEK